MTRRRRHRRTGSGGARRMHDGHGHGHGTHGHLHDAPPAMAMALIVLAIGSVAAGYVGVPHALGGHNRIEAFLEPAFEAHAMAPATEFQVSEGRPGAAPRDAAPGTRRTRAAPTTRPS